MPYKETNDGEYVYDMDEFEIAKESFELLLSEMADSLAHANSMNNYLTEVTANLEGEEFEMREDIDKLEQRLEDCLQSLEVFKGNYERYEEVSEEYPK